ncbi:Aminoglycoside phosphotransferase [Paenibacillus sp. 1_12]|uniref:phosphotransferase n=1 Tax=Paenibacillus sp. 1_12 TaxID=1566278 RepID=UPI0008E947C2|nr:phosphotransferase [Paenibacillus sp. 1_12]SFM47027.1 Aminoglycoside phosphotransferase [Paenibacillus sp. 1_12]
MNIHDIPVEISDQIGEIHNINFPRQGHTSIVAIVATSNKRFVIKKTENDLYNEWLSEEYKALQYLSQTELLVPKVYSYHVEKKSRWLLMDYMNGISLREYLSREPSLNEKQKAISNFGLCLRKIHECPCPIGLIKNDKPWLDTMLLKAENNLTQYEVDGSEELLSRLKEKRPKPIENTLIHGDFTIDNVLVNEGNIVGIIDWSGAAYGDPRYDVALAIRRKHNAFDNDIDKEIFFNAYGKLRITDEEFNYFENGIYNFF